MKDFTSSSQTPWYLYAHEIERVTVGTGITRVGAFAFCDIANLTSVELSDTVQNLGAYAFSNCSNLKDIQFGSGLTYLEDGVFYLCTGLEQLSFSNPVISVGKEVFAYCTKLETVTVPLWIEEIPDSMFEGCYALREIRFPIGLKSIGKEAIKDCNQLERVIFCGVENDWEKISKGANWDAQAGQGTVDGTYELTFHNYDNGVIVLPPTADESGRIKYTCTLCNTSLTKTLDPIQTILYGDVNGDEKIDLNDVILLKLYLATYDYDTNTSLTSVTDGADVNGDGRIDLNDVVLLATYLANFDYGTGTSNVLLGPQVSQ